MFGASSPGGEAPAAADRATRPEVGTLPLTGGRAWRGPPGGQRRLSAAIPSAAGPGGGRKTFPRAADHRPPGPRRRCGDAPASGDSDRPTPTRTY